MGYGFWGIVGACALDGWDFAGIFGCVLYFWGFELVLKFFVVLCLHLYVSVMN